MDLLCFPFDSLERLEIDFVPRVLATPAAGTSAAAYVNYAHITAPFASQISSHLQTVALYADWSVLANIPFEDLGLDGVLGNMNKVQFRTLEVYIKRTTRSASLQDSSFEYLLDKLVTVADFIESLTIDYTEGPDFDPHVGLGQCDRAFSFDMFLRLRKLIVLQ
jgi:hypothetical protein